MARLQTYRITSNFLAPLNTVRAASIEAAADVFARRTYGRNAIAWRTTGTTGLSGYFRPYHQYRDGFMSAGEPFHVRES